MPIFFDLPLFCQSTLERVFDEEAVSTSGKRASCLVFGDLLSTIIFWFHVVFSYREDRFLLRGIAAIVTSGSAIRRFSRGENREFLGIGELFPPTPSGFLDGFAVFLR
jgi:hypothetical protein